MKRIKLICDNCGATEGCGLEVKMENVGDYPNEVCHIWTCFNGHLCGRCIQAFHAALSKIREDAKIAKSK